ncbi:unnamed protein product [Didymodactylos carnosus]|uniref:Nucleoside diphosphate kinase n=1 Tax=Didymodactylos carnosus TaxID=1234261 RepID=A0A814X8V4_9BILA|nr:unnamed protein product [Didymodactylos carnosus]CAF1370875.1 unnamed protein product [Didymodactylos carnosus]CAF3976587.1 unnamed protein product [Didymodactylos carnosus]CAF4180118.1 unnamed protein product [Didymodactylos carnosus]
MGDIHERTFILVKPDGVARGLVGEITKRFEHRGFKPVAIKLVLVWEGFGVIAVGRKMLGETDPAKSEPGTIRGDFAIATGRNVIHGSDSEKSAKREIDLWFRPDEVTQWTSAAGKWIHE